MNNKFLKKIIKVFDYIYMKKFFFSQKEFEISEQKKLRYVFQKNKNSKNLIIVFSSCTRVGVKGRYNYIRTLKNTNCNKLFILDDFGYDSRGLFYLGEDNKFEISIAVKNLLKEIVTKNNIENSIYVGSSKGGYAALYFGLDNLNSTIIAGAPQYYLGFYLKDAKDDRRLNQICGNNEKDISALNNVIKGKINKNHFEGKIYLHYSTEEHTFSEHIEDLLKDLKGSKSIIETDEKKYKNHSEVGIYFADYLVKILREIKV